MNYEKYRVKWGFYGEVFNLDLGSQGRVFGESVIRVRRRMSEIQLVSGGCVGNGENMWEGERCSRECFSNREEYELSFGEERELERN